MRFWSWLAALLAATTTAADAAADNDVHPPARWHRWMLLDPYYSDWRSEVRAGPAWWRPSGALGSSTGAEIGLVPQILVTRAGPVFAGASVALTLRVLDGKSAALSLPQYTLFGGLSLGPVEPQASVGLSLLTVDVFRGDYSFEMASPRVGAGLGLRLGRLHVSAEVHTEYLWRWIGASNYRIQGLLFGLGYDTHVGKSP
jgi:hypothetical protein